MDANEAFQLLIEHHLEYDKTKDLKVLSFQEFKKEQKRRHWDCHHGCVIDRFHIRYRYKNKVFVEIDRQFKFYFYFDEFVDRLFQEINHKQLSLF